MIELILLERYLYADNISVENLAKEKKQKQQQQE